MFPTAQPTLLPGSPEHPNRYLYISCFDKLYFVRNPLSQVQEILQSFVPTWQNLMQPSSMNCAQNMPAPTQQSDPEWVLSDSSPLSSSAAPVLHCTHNAFLPPGPGSLAQAGGERAVNLLKLSGGSGISCNMVFGFGSSNKLIPSCCILPFESSAIKLFAVEAQSAILRIVRYLPCLHEVSSSHHRPSAKSLLPFYGKIHTF